MLVNEYTGEALVFPFEPNAVWSEEEDGLQQFEGTLFTISCQLWPAGYGGAAGTAGKMPAATAAILHRFRGSGQNGDFPVEDSDYAVLAERTFQAPTELEVKLQVEAWVKEVCNRIVAALLPALDALQAAPVGGEATGGKLLAMPARDRGQ